MKTKTTFPTLADGSTWAVALDAKGEPLRAALIIPPASAERALGQLRERHNELEAGRAQLAREREMGTAIVAAREDAAIA
jgi:hypothetical protein